MRLARYAIAKGRALGIVKDGGIVRVTDRIPGIGSDMVDLIRKWPLLSSTVAELGRAMPPDHALAEIELLAPVARPGKIWGIGLNYADHVAEAKLGQPEYQSWFVMAQTTIAGPYQPIQLPRASNALDYEAELVFIIGQGGRHLAGETAAQAIFGYCVGNDVSVRDWQLRSGQFSIGKSFDTHAPIGPWIVTADEIDARNLAIRSYVNGNKRQDSNTSHLIFDPVAQIEHLSQAMTLEPGDVIFTGTPGGVGAAMNPPQYLHIGDRVRIEIDGIGYIENEVVGEA